MTNGTIIIAGGGIAGLALALGLARAGRPVTLCEQATAFAPVGAGITLSPSACRGLAWLGIGEALAQVAEPGEAPVLRDWTSGAIGATMPSAGHLGETRRISRADLHRLLSDALQRETGVRIEMDARVSGVTSRADGVEATLDDGRVIGGEWLFGADGARSSVRGHVLADGVPTYAGFIAWRFMVPIAKAEHLLVGYKATITAGPLASLTCYTVEQGRTLNCVAITCSGDWAAEGWSEAGDPAELAAIFADANADTRALVALAQPGRLFRWGLFDRPVAAQWSRGRIAILGDAAHPMLPFLAYGAGMAIEDAVVLSRAVERFALERAVAVFERERIPRARRLHAASRAQAQAFAQARGGDLPVDAPMLDPSIFAYDPVSVSLRE